MVAIESRDDFSSTLWVKSINNAVEECQLAEKAMQVDKAMFTVTDRRDSKNAVARLLLVVQEAYDLLPISRNLERHRVFSSLMV